MNFRVFLGVFRVRATPCDNNSVGRGMYDVLVLSKYFVLQHYCYIYIFMYVCVCVCMYEIGTFIKKGIGSDE